MKRFIATLLLLGVAGFGLGQVHECARRPVHRYELRPVH